MLRHLAASRWVKPALLVVVLGFCGYALYAERAAVAAAAQNLSWYAVAGALIAVIAGLGCMMLSWRALLADLGSPLPLRPAIRVLFVGQLAKYVPGAVWAAGAQMELGRAYQVPRTRSATAAATSMLVALATALLTAAVALPLNSASAARHYWWALVLVLPALIGLYPPLTSFLLNHALRLVRRPPLERRISAAGMSRAVGWALLGWGFFSLHAWLLISSMTGAGLEVFPMAAGAFALAWSVGFILVPLPGGAGAREAALVFALQPIMPRPSAIVIAAVSRLVMTVADLGWAGFGYWLGRGERRRGVQAAGPAAGNVTSRPQAAGQPGYGDGAKTVATLRGEPGEHGSYP